LNPQETSNPHKKYPARRCGIISSTITTFAKEGRRIMATSSFGQIVVLDDDMADRIIESNKTANDYPFGQPTGFFQQATEEDYIRLAEASKRKK
jgi:hypothetical protein